MIHRFIAKELSHPGPILGQLLLAPLWNRRNVQLNEAALAAMPLNAHDRVLEVGFGGGYLLRRIAAQNPENSLFGVDISPAMVSFVQQREQRRVKEGLLTLKCAPAESLPFRDASFSRICSVNSLFYWQDPQAVFAEMRRVAEEGARLVLCFTDRSSLDHKRFARHGLNLPEVEEIQQMLLQAGFRLEPAHQLSDKHRQFWCVQASRI